MKNLQLLIAALFLLLLGCREDDMGIQRNNNAEQPLGSEDVTMMMDMKKVQNFRTHLNKQDAGTESKGQGQAIFQVKDGVVYYKLIVANITNVTQAHIHLAPKGVNGPIVAWLYPAGPPATLIPGRSDGVLAEGVIMEGDLAGPLTGKPLADLINAMKAGGTYVNVHTSQAPGGEIRGQIK